MFLEVHSLECTFMTADYLSILRSGWNYGPPSSKFTVLFLLRSDAKRSGGHYDGGLDMDTGMSARELYERGRMLRQAKMYDRALADFQQVIHDPNYAGQAHTQIALCYRALGRHTEAAAALEKALDSPVLSPNEHLHVLYLLGQTLESLGRHVRWKHQELSAHHPQHSNLVLR